MCKPATCKGHIHKAGRKKQMLKFKKVREEKGLSQSRLACISGVNRTLLSDAENGRRALYPKAKAAVAEALGWTGDPEKLFEDEEVNDGSED